MGYRKHGFRFCKGYSFFFNKVELLILRQSFVVSAQFCQHFSCRKPGKTLCFDSEVDLHLLKLGNRTFFSNPGAQAPSGWSILRKIYGQEQNSRVGLLGSYNNNNKYYYYLFLQRIFLTPKCALQCQIYYNLYTKKCKKS